MHNIKLPFSVFECKKNNTKSRNLLDVDFLPEKRHLYLIFTIIFMVIVTNNRTMVNFTIDFTICLFYFQNICMFFNVIGTNAYFAAYFFSF